MRIAAVVGAVLLFAAVLLVAAGAAGTPLSRTCAESIPESTCAATVEAALKRGLEPLHPLILASHVEPGPAIADDQLGHKATVTFDLLGVPGPTAVRMFYDMGGHWGGQSNRDDAEVAAWALAPIVLAGVLGVAILGLAWYRRRAATG